MNFKTALIDKQKSLVEEYLIPAGITDKRVIAAFMKIPRHKFVPKKYKDEAYFDQPLPIGRGQTISQPSLVALMTQALNLKGNEKVLEIGTGSGFQTAILAKIARIIFTIERIENLADTAKKNLKNLGIKNVYVINGDGSLGLPEQAPFDAIMVTAGVPEIPKPLIDQLKVGGKLVIPVGINQTNQIIKLGIKQENSFETWDIEGVRFVPLIGEHGWKEK